MGAYNNRTDDKRYYGTRKWTVSLEKIGCILMCLPFSDAEGLIRMGFNWDIYVSIHCLFLAALFLITRCKINKPMLWYGLYYLIILISTLMNVPEYAYIIIFYGGRMISFIFVMEYYSKSQRLHLLLSALRTVISVEIFINVVFQIFAQDFFGHAITLNYYNFFTPDNNLGVRYVGFVLLVYITRHRAEATKLKPDFYVWTALCFFSLIKAWAGAGMTMFFAFMCLVGLRRTKLVKPLTPFVSAWLNIGFIAAFALFKLPPIFSFFIDKVLHKTYSMNVRLELWHEAVEAIRSKPLLGYGIGEHGTRAILYYRTTGGNIPSHNVVLEVLIQGGMVGMTAFLLIYYFAGQALKKADHPSEMLSMIKISVFSILLMGIAGGSLYDPVASLPLIFCFYYKQFLMEEDKACRTVNRTLSPKPDATTWGR